MLMRFLHSLFGGSVAADNAPGDATGFPVDDLRNRIRLFEGAPIGSHLEILYRDCRIGPLEFLPLYRDCLARSETSVSAWKSFIRVQSALNLAHYYLHALTIPGKRIECGVFRGFSALRVCEVARAAADRPGGYAGEDLHLVDSFAGFPEPLEQDFIAMRDRSHAVSGAAFHAGDGAAPEEHLRTLLAGFPHVTIHKGWIPAVYSSLPESLWSFAHIDVDLYEATLTSLQYFYPRMSPGGVIVCDDYGSTLFPGARTAWDEFCASAGLSFIVLETGQAVLLSGSAP